MLNRSLGPEGGEVEGRVQMHREAKTLFYPYDTLSELVDCTKFPFGITCRFISQCVYIPIHGISLCILTCKNVSSCKDCRGVCINPLDVQHD